MKNKKRTNDYKKIDKTKRKNKLWSQGRPYNYTDIIGGRGFFVQQKFC